MSSWIDDSLLARVAQHAPVGLFEADEHGALRFVSEQWCEITGLDPGAALGSHWLEAIVPEDRAAVHAAWGDAVAHGRGLDTTYRLFSGEQTKTVHTSMAPVTDESGLLTAFAGVTTDLTHVWERDCTSAQTLEHLRIAGEVMPQLMWIAAPDGTIEYYNRPWLDYTGVSVEAMRERGVKNVVHPDELGMTWEHWNQALVTGEPYEIEYRLRNARTGAFRWFIGRAVPYRGPDGSIVRWIGTATDIDAQKRANDNLRFVLDASNALGSNLDIESVCNTLAQLAIQRVADWCFIVLKDANGGYATQAIAHRDPRRVQLIERYRDLYPVHRGSPLDRAIRRNTPILVPSVSERELEISAQNAEHLHVLQSLGMHSAMLVPLSTPEGTVYGGITLVSSESAHAYNLADLEVAELVARRAAVAMQTAYAFAQERQGAQRSRFIAEASELLVQSLDLQTMLDRFAAFLVDHMADLAYVILAEDREALRTVACAHADPHKQHIAERLRGQRTMRPEAEENAIWMLSQHRTLLHKTIPMEAVLASMWEYLAPDVRALDVRSAITVPLFSRGETFGAMVVYWCTPGKVYSEDDAELFTDLGRRLSIAIEHQRTIERERRIAEALQQALLPQPGRLPKVDGLAFAAHYRPSTHESQVGGDWYDAVTLPDGSIFVSVGDVTGRGLRAAGLMGKLRQALGMAALYERDPARMLDAVDFHLRSRRSASLATAFVGIIDPDRAHMRYACAGHPPPLLRCNGELIELRSDGLPLGLRDQHVEQAQNVSLHEAELLVLYTDGLTEATRDIAFGEQRLAFLATSQAIQCVRNPAEFLCDACLPPDAQDDTAVLTISFGARASWAFDAENAKAAHEARTEFVKYLRERSRADADFSGAELVFGELVGNVVRHAPGPIEVQIECGNSQCVLHVIDRGRGIVRDPGLPHDPLSEGGRGLYIIEQLTDGLHIERIAGYGNHVAAVLRL
ncbi:MAG TPA: SpoIIE family protein phosphatase [Candidatus Baltobacteraceae bacterium]|nr:SpoIIE family protein phosphatase [Candidatus Baltobacteraceae bacterium]